MRGPKYFLQKCHFLAQKVKPLTKMSLVEGGGRGEENGYFKPPGPSKKRQVDVCFFKNVRCSKISLASMYGKD